MKDFIHLFSAYDNWANTRIAERLQREGDNVLDHHVKSSFPSLRLSTAHIRDATNTWYERIFGEPRLAYDERIDSLVKMSLVMNDKVRTLDEAQLLEPVHYANARGQYQQPRWQLLTHCFNHASYHRGQVITIMWQLDLAEVPNTDMVAYQRLL